MALTAEEKRILKQKQAALTDEEFLAMNDAEFRARFRERIHHTLEIQTYSAAYRGKTLRAEQANYARRMVSVWERKGLSTQLPDYIYAKKIIGFAEKLAAGEKIDLSTWKPTLVTNEACESFFTILKERRSVREFTDQRVADELIDRILDAGLWAAHSCNLQSIRYLVVRESDTPGLFLGSDVPGGPVHLVVCQDQRVYLANQTMPERNHLLDAGAAAQNMALAAHAVGLEGVWLTFNDTMIERLRNYFSLPDYINIVTYVDIGYGDQTPCPPLRDSVENCVLGRV